MRVKCPRCFTALTADLFAWECVGTCPTHADPHASAVAGSPQVCRPITIAQKPADNRRWRAPATEAVRCQDCRSSVREICPACHLPLLTGWREATTVCVALAGARATGKSVYLGVVIKQLEQLFIEHGSSLRFGNEITRRIYHERYEKVLYEELGIMPPTSRIGTENTYQSNPMIFTYELPRTGRVFLVLRDVAGEDLELPSEDLEHLSYFSRADAALFMFDPSAVGEIRELLRDYLPPQLNAFGNPERAFETILGLIGTAPVPVGIVLSKFDTIQALKDVDHQQWRQIMSNPGSALTRDPGLYPPGYDDIDGRQVHAEVDSLLHLLHARKLINSVQGYGARRTARFFGVSALGEAAEGNRLHPRGIAPYRCLDPLRWALWSDDLDRR